MTSDRLRRQVRERANGLCEYCLCPDHLISAPFHCEHIQPRNAGGETALDNLAWSCPSCNGNKYTYTHAIDPKTGRRVPLFHPRRQQWKRHFQWRADFISIVGRTQTGRATVEALKMNRTTLINLRRILHIVGEHPPEITKG